MHMLIFFYVLNYMTGRDEPQKNLTKPGNPGIVHVRIAYLPRAVDSLDSSQTDYSPGPQQRQDQLVTPAANVVYTVCHAQNSVTGRPRKTNCLPYEEGDPTIGWLSFKHWMCSVQVVDT